MRFVAPVLAIALGLAGGAALGGRPLTNQERAQVALSLQAHGCSGGAIQFDAGRFEVDNARCGDGKTYDLEFDRSYKLLSKRLER